MTTLRNFRDGLIAVAAYFAVCALTCDAHAATRKDSAMSIATPFLTPAKNPALSRWHPHTDEPNETTRAIILIQPKDADPVMLPELYVWDVAEGYWISASSHLKIRHKEFYWAELYPMLENAAAPSWQRDEDATVDLLWKVGLDVSPATVFMWTDAQVRQAEDWAAVEHLRNGNVIIEAPPMPEFLSKFERSPS